MSVILFIILIIFKYQNQIYMNNEHQFYQTPSKALQHSELKQQIKPVVQSRLYYNHQQQQASNQKADQIQSSIHSIGEQLKNLFNQMQNHTDKYSEQYLQLQASRKELKKKLIDLDFQHKMIFANRLRNQKNQEPKKEQSQQQKTQQNKPKDTNDIIQSRRKLRISQLEAQLAQSKLQRSRIQQLSNQLQYLRLSYSDPYLTYNYDPYYSYPSYYSSYYSRLWF